MNPTNYRPGKNNDSVENVNKMIEKNSFRRIKSIVVAAILLVYSLSIFADEGMWIPLLLDKYTIEEMQSKGFRLTAEDIYDINNSSLKDAVIIFGSGCSGGVVSDEGLIFTNHHCGYGAIQSHSSVEKNLLKNGYWAMSREEELPSPGVKATFLVRIEDVTERILQNLESGTDDGVRENIIRTRIEQLRLENIRKSENQVAIKSFYYGNEYYMFVYEVFEDVRLVAAPPESIGNFGGDTDNWVWPRHTGDFSVFRIYADSSNAPASYSPDNVPYKPKKSLSISLGGIDEHDFSMILGYPGSTSYYLISDAIKILQELTLPHNIALRDKRLEVMDHYMKQDDAVRIQYASKYRSISNAWKKWKGVIWGFGNSDILSVKESEEEKFNNWVNSDESRKEEYGNILPELKDLYSEMENYTLVYEYANESVLAVEVLKFAAGLNSMLVSGELLKDEERIALRDKYLADATRFYKDFYLPIDKEIFAFMLERFHEDISEEFHPEIYSLIEKKYDSDYQKYVDKILSKSIFADEEKLTSLVKSYPAEGDKLSDIINKDPVFECFLSFSLMYSFSVMPTYISLYNKIEDLYNNYMKALREMETERRLFSDANFTMRLSYGEAEGYSPKDGMYYGYYTTLDGIFAKNSTGIEDYTVPEKLMDLYYTRDYGDYAGSDSTMRVCFIAKNHTSGGNSGSPVLDANGRLLGLNFDRNWEGTMSDYLFDPSTCRNITVDVRYILFIIDKFGEAGYLLEEMNIMVND